MIGPLELPRPSGIATSHATLPVLRLERHEVPVAEREIQLVVVERHAAHRRVHAEALLPDQIAGLAVERLDVPLLLLRKTTPSCASGDGWLVPPSLIGATHASCSCAALSRVIWVQRAEVAGGLIAAQHRPVAGRRVAQHLVGDARVVLDLAGDGETQDRRRGLPAAARARLAARGLRRRARAASRRRLAGAGRQPRPRQERADRHRRGGGERLRARRRAVELQDVGGDGQIGGFRQPAGLFGRHRLDRGQQVARRAAAPAAAEAGAGERRRPGEVRAVAARAGGVVGGASGRGLIGGERARRSAPARPVTSAQAREQASRSATAACVVLIAAATPTGSRRPARALCRRASGCRACLAGATPPARASASTEPEMVPLVALVTVRSVTALPRAPLAMPSCSRATVAGPPRPFEGAGDRQRAGPTAWPPRCPCRSRGRRPRWAPTRDAPRTCRRRPCRSPGQPSDRQHHGCRPPD